MIMASKQLQLIEQRRSLAASRGFTIDYQLSQEHQENIVSYKQLAPATKENYRRASSNWEL